MNRFGIAAAAVGLALFAVGLSAWVLSSAWYTEALSTRYSLAESAGLTRTEIAGVAEQVRVFVVSGKPEPPATVDGRPGFDDDAVSHLTDVGRVLAAGRMITLALGAALAAAAAINITRERWGALAAALKGGALIGAGLVALAVTFALTDFSAFFSAFHGLFFAEGTWMFPSDSLLIRVFPEPFWVTSGAAWGGLVLGCCAAYWIVGVWFGRRQQATGE